jgi:hypothetical protein
MLDQAKSDSKFKRSKIVLITSLLTLAISLIVQFVNVYHFAFTGAIFEMLWLPVISLIIILPVVSLFFWVTEKFKLKSLYLYSLLISISTILVLIFLT